MNTSMTNSKYFNKYLTDILIKDTNTVSKIRLFCGIFDAINDPIMGVIVDKTRTKHGQMRPYIKWAPYFVSIVMILLFMGIPSTTPHLVTILISVFLLVMLDVTYTAFDIPMGALAFSITPNGIERTKLYGISSIGRSIIGALPQVFVAAAALLPYFKDHTHHAYITSAAISAVGIILLTRLTFKNTVERAPHKENVPSVGKCFKLLFKNRPLFMLFIGNIFFILCKIPEQVSYYFVYDLMFNGKYNVAIDVIKFPGFLLAGILVPMLVRKLGKNADSRKIYRFCCISAIALHSLFALTTYNGLINKTPDQSVSLFTAILVILFTGLCTLPMEFKNLIQKEMEAETVDFVEWKTGERVEGIMLSIMSFTGKIENTFASSIGLSVLGMTHYIEHADGSLVQSPQTNLALFLMTTLVPAIGYLLMLIPMHFYNITAKSHRQMLEEIAARRMLDISDSEIA